MNITLTSLEALVLKATNENFPCGQPDHQAVEAFWAITMDSPEGPQLAAQALSARIHSQNPREALLALSMLDQCMRRGDKKFLLEIGKFRFLNELIKLVSPKYLADHTAADVKIRILQLICSWSLEYPKETKFKVAYDMLINQGVINGSLPPLHREEMDQQKPKIKSATFEDEGKSKLLQKLLQSKKPEDLQHANRLIKTMVIEDEQRSAAHVRHAQKVSAALESAGLLKVMLQHAASATPDEEQLMRELHGECARLRNVMERMAECEDMADYLDKILSTCDVLDEVFALYRVYYEDKTTKMLDQQDALARQARDSGDSLLDFAGGVDRTVKPAKNALVELGDIFSAGCNVMEPMKPDSLLNAAAAPGPSPAPGPAPAPGLVRWSELDALGEQLLQQALPAAARRGEPFNSKTKKVPMNALDTAAVKQEPLDDALLDLDFFTKPTEQPEPEPAQQTHTLLDTDDVMVDISTNHSEATNDHSVENVIDALSVVIDNNEAQCNQKTKKNDGIQPLTDIDLTLESVKPSKVPPIIAFQEDDGLTVTLHFCKNRPRPEVYVVVVSTTSKKETAIEDYKFQAVVPKDCKVRMLPPSGTSLPPCNPFLPPPALTQLLLLAARPDRPARPPLDLKFVISYSCEGETCSEIGEVKDLSLHEL